jgi:hypothetical protein
MSLFIVIYGVSHLICINYLVQFLLSGNVLLLATIGLVVLVLTRATQTSKFQVTFKQLSRIYNSVIYI